MLSWYHGMSWCISWEVYDMSYLSLLSRSVVWRWYNYSNQRWETTWREQQHHGPPPDAAFVNQRGSTTALTRADNENKTAASAEHCFINIVHQNIVLITVLPKQYFFWILNNCGGVSLSWYGHLFYHLPGFALQSPDLVTNEQQSKYSPGKRCGILNRFKKKNIYTLLNIFSIKPS